MGNISISRITDQFGRVTIPIELRRILNIRCGDFVEVYVHNEQLILKKYSTLRLMEDIAHDICHYLNQVSGHSILITDSGKVQAIAGELLPDVLLQQPIADGIWNDIQEEASKMIDCFDESYILKNTKICNLKKIGEAFVCPVISTHMEEGVGAIVILNSKLNLHNGKPITATEIKLAKLSALYLSMWLEQH